MKTHTAAFEPHLFDKRQLAQRVNFSPRWIDFQLSKGMPHLKLGARRVRFELPVVLDWLRDQYGTRRRSPAVRRGPATDVPPPATTAAAEAATTGEFEP